jgi:hypothetical protein
LESILPDLLAQERVDEKLLKRLISKGGREGGREGGDREGGGGDRKDKEARRTQNTKKSDRVLAHFDAVLPPFPPSLPPSLPPFLTAVPAGPFTPAEVLVALHSVDPEKIPSSLNLPLKKYLDTLQKCLGMKTLFPQTALSRKGGREGRGEGRRTGRKAHGR